MAYDHLIYDIDDENICWITLDRPKVLNAINDKLCTELSQALEAADRDDRAHVVVLRGAGRGFCSGHDLTEDAEDAFGSVYDYRNHYTRQQHEFIAVWRISKPVIASVHYCAIGKGFELATTCDITIVTDDTRLGYNEMRYGIAGMNMILPWLVNMKTAKDMMFTGRELSAAEARDLGLVTQVVAPDELAAATLKKARLVARLPNATQRVHKQYLNRVYEMQGLRMAADYYQDIMHMMSYCPVPEYREFTDTTVKHGLRAALAEANKRYEGLDEP